MRICRPVRNPLGARTGSSRSALRPRLPQRAGSPRMCDTCPPTGWPAAASGPPGPILRQHGSPSGWSGRASSRAPGSGSWYQSFIIAHDAPAAHGTALAGARGRNVVGVLKGRDPKLAGAVHRRRGPLRPPRHRRGGEPRSRQRGRAPQRRGRQRVRGRRAARGRPATRPRRARRGASSSSPSAARKKDCSAARTS